MVNSLLRAMLPYIEQNNLKEIISKAVVTLAEERAKMKKMAKKNNSKVLENRSH